MYSLLLVDDEKLIRQGVSELLATAFPELDITTAASAPETLEILEQRKVDLAVLDIQMPQMTGIDLYDIVRERWPRCKLIFLTGYPEFDYVYKVHQHARYVLKAEDDSKIVDAVRESLSEIENDLMLQSASDSILHSLQRRMYLERKLLFKELVEDTGGSWHRSREILDNMGLDLDLDGQVYSVMLRCRALQTMDYLSYSSALEDILTLIERTYFDVFRGTYFGYNQSVVYLLLQSKKELGREKTLNLLKGTTELMQKAVGMNLNLPLSALIRDCTMPFEKAIRDYIAVSDNMLAMEADEIRVMPINRGKPSPGFPVSGEMKRELSMKVSQLDNRFDNMDRDAVLSVVDELRASLQDVNSMNDIFAMEMYCSVSAKVLSYVQRLSMGQEEQFLPVQELYNISRFQSWSEAFSNLRRMIQQVFGQVDRSIDDRNEDVVNKIKHYIHHHLDGDTSLYTLSDYVHLCPEHLLRVFKKETGDTILQYINDLKLARAKQLLAESDLQIKDIAAELGFTSAGYFGRFFKGKMGITPNAYREQKQQ